MEFTRETLGLNDRRHGPCARSPSIPLAKRRPSSMEDDRIFVSLTENVLNSSQVMDLVRSPEAGAIVLFAGTTRNNFKGIMCIPDQA